MPLDRCRTEWAIPGPPRRAGVAHVGRNDLGAKARGSRVFLDRLVVRVSAA